MIKPKAILLLCALSLTQATASYGDEGRFVKEKLTYSNAEQADNFYELATQAWYNGEQEKAITLCYKVLELMPAHALARSRLISYYQDNGNPIKAEKLLDVGLKINKTEPFFIKQKVLMLNNNKEHKQALSVLLTMPKEQQYDSEYRQLLAFTYLQEGLFDLAQEYYKKLLVLEQNNNNWRLGLAIAQEAAGDEKQALMNFMTIRSRGGVEVDVLNYVQQRIDALHPDNFNHSKGS